MYEAREAMRTAFAIAGGIIAGCQLPLGRALILAVGVVLVMACGVGHALGPDDDNGVDA